MSPARQELDADAFETGDADSRGPLDDYSKRLGESLRIVRERRGLSLNDVARASGGQFKAATLGTYERGERRLSFPRLCRLAEFYDAPVRSLLPRSQPGTSEHTPPAARPGAVVIAVSALDQMEGEALRPLKIFVHSVHAARGDSGDGWVVLREEDRDAVCALLMIPVSALSDRLRSLGLLIEPNSGH